MTTFHIETYGCSHNFADSERMAGLLKNAQFSPVDSIDEADIIIINTCTVKSPTANAFFTRLEKLKEEHPYKAIVIAGCIPQTEPKKIKEYSLVGTKQIHKIVEVVEEALNENKVHNLEVSEVPPLDLPKLRKNPIVEIIPISRGCLSGCTFCKTKHARGNLQSYPIEEIINVALKAIGDNVQEIWLTSQDTMCYGFDTGTNLANLLKEIIKLPGRFKIRVGMGNPVHLLKFKDELIPLFNHNKLFKFIHLPAQSGSDKVLERMQRGNTNKEYLELVKEIKEKVPKITFATDIIVGFPGETDEDFWQTLELAREINPDIINISRFWARPNTAAARMKQLPVETIKHRSTVLSDIFNNISRIRNEKWIGWEGGIIIDEKGKEEGQWVGRNYCYKPVIVNGNYNLGDVVNVRILKTGRFDLKGEVIC